MDSSSDPGRERRSTRFHRWPRVVVGSVLGIATALLVARMLAPYYVERAINRRLSQIPGYSGHVAGIHLGLWRGAYRLYGVQIVKSNGKVREPFFTAREIDFSIAWREIFHRKLVSDIYVADGQLVFLHGPSEETSQLTADRRWQDVINDIFPIDIMHFEIKGGIIRFVDTTREPNVDIAVRNLEVVATGLRNRPSGNGEPFPAKIDLSGQSIGNGRLRLVAKLEPLADQPHFSLAVELTKVSLPSLNELLRAYAGIDVSQGNFEVFGQMAMQEGHYEGYVKPFLEHVDFKNADDENKSLGKRIWKGMVVGAAELFKNKETKQMGTRIPFSGDSGKMDVSTLRAIANGLHHGFIKALPAGFEGTTHPDDKRSKLPPLAPEGPKPSA